MRIRVEKEFLGIKKGSEFDVEDDCVMLMLVQQGVVSEVDKNGFGYKLGKLFDRELGMYSGGRAWERWVKAAIEELAEEHYGVGRGCPDV